VIGNFFEQYGTNIIDWPHRDCCNVMAPPNGYAFVIFDHEHAVRRLINASDVKQGKLLVDMKDGETEIKTINEDLPSLPVGAGDPTVGVAFSGKGFGVWLLSNSDFDS
ncbi:hypothetical protein LOAG_10913, partial [Loa loa]